MFAPKGIGALVTSPARLSTRPPLQPLMFGGGQERGLRPGTLPVALIAGLGLASSLALKEHEQAEPVAASHQGERRGCAGTPGHRDELDDLDRTVATHPQRLDPGYRLGGRDRRAQGLVAVSNGSACTSQSYEPSHVLTAAGLPEDQMAGALRLSWSHLTPSLDWTEVSEQLRRFRRSSSR